MKDYTIAFVTAEMMIPELGKIPCDGNFRGGLGDLCGHIVEGFGKCGINAIPITYLYPYHWQTGDFIDYERTPTGPKAFDLEVDIHFEKRTVSVFEIKRSGVTTYGICDPLGRYLYPGDKGFKLEQAAFLGRAVPALLKKLGVRPDVVWTQEWMTGLVIPNMKDDPYFDGTKHLFTMHTPVKEALEVFPEEWFGGFAIDSRHFQTYFRDGALDMSYGALRQCDLATGVSKENGEVLRQMFPEHARKIIGIMNGVSRDFILPERIKRCEKPVALWATHETDKRNFLDVVEEFGHNLSFYKPLVGLVRRLAWYKNQKPMLETIIEAVCADRGKILAGGRRGLGMNLVVGGVAHENDEGCKSWMREFTDWMSNPALSGRFAYIPKYSEKLRTAATRGCDIWVSCPWERYEACGTSDFFAKMAGNVNVATRGGGIKEHGTEVDVDLNGDGSFREVRGDTLFIDPYNPERLYEQLAKASGWFYDQINGVNDLWMNLRWNNFLGGEKLDVRHMIEAYRELCFEPLLERQALAVSA